MDILRKDHKLTYVGTVKKIKSKSPTSRICEYKRTPGKVFNALQFQKNTTTVSYVLKKRKNVILVSTLHHDDSIDKTTGEDMKPEIIILYNVTKGGVDNR